MSAGANPAHREPDEVSDVIGEDLRHQVRPRVAVEEMVGLECVQELADHRHQAQTSRRLFHRRPHGRERRGRSLHQGVDELVDKDSAGQPRGDHFAGNEAEKLPALRLAHERVEKAVDLWILHILNLAISSVIARMR